MMPEILRNNAKVLLFNILFVAFCAGVFLFLWNAPPETTARLPHDSDHARFFGMDKKEAEKECGSCHEPGGIYPLPPGHPPKYRCLLCHKREPLSS